MAVAPALLFLEQLDENYLIGVLIPWIAIGAGFSIFIYFFSRGSEKAKTKGMKYAKKTFFIMIILLGIYMFGAFPLGMSASDFRFAASFVITIALFVSILTFLIGYFRAPHGK